MQTLSLEDELRRIYGVPYTLDFYQDFTTFTLGDLDNEAYIQEIIKEIMNPQVIDVEHNIQNYNSSLEDRQRSEEFWRIVDKMEKKEAKRVKKWKKHRKKVTAKQAYKNFNRVYKDMLGG